MSDDLVDDEGGHEEEGVEAFIRMSAALDNLRSHLDAFDQGLNLSVRAAEQAASKAATAALDAKGVAEHAKAVAQAQARSQATWLACGVLAGMLVAGGAAYRLGHDSGWESGRAEGYGEARDEKAAAGWANTPAGQLAQALDRVGSLSQLARCTAQGWKPMVQDGHRSCLPSATSDGKMQGWSIP